MVAIVNEKNKGKRKSVTLDQKWHRRFRILAARREMKIEDLMDEAAIVYLRTLTINRD